MGSSITSILNSNESHFILCVSKTTLYLYTVFLSISNDMCRCDRWSCFFKAMKMKNVTSEKSWIDGHVSSASWKSAKRCKAMEHKLSDQPWSKYENYLYWTMHLCFSLSLSNPFIFMICLDLFTSEISPTEKNFR